VRKEAQRLRSFKAYKVVAIGRIRGKRRDRVTISEMNKSEPKAKKPLHSTRRNGGDLSFKQSIVSPEKSSTHNRLPLSLTRILDASQILFS
jgi:hypothetical protein